MTLAAHCRVRGTAPARGPTSTQQQASVISAQGRTRGKVRKVPEKYLVPVERFRDEPLADRIEGWMREMGRQEAAAPHATTVHRTDRFEARR